MTASTLDRSADTITRRYRPKGSALELFEARDREILIEGPAGTGKTRAVLELFNLLCLSYAGLICLFVRKHAVTLTSTALTTFDQEVLHPASGVVFFGGSRHEPACYRYPNGSRIVVGGMGDGKEAVQKILSSRYDAAYVNEGTELAEDEFETLTTRLRQPEHPARREDGEPFIHQRIIVDCNPSYGGHWLNVRCGKGKTRRIVSHLEDNPAYFDDAGQPTPAGARYLATLDALSGARYERLRLGLWTGVENAIYPQLERSRHLADLPEGLTFDDGAIGLDYGDVHPSAVVAVTRDSLGRYWVRECWCEEGGDLGAIEAAIAGMKRDYDIWKVQVDPMLKGWEKLMHVTRADASPGSRKERIETVSRLLNLQGRPHRQREIIFGQPLEWEGWDLGGGLLIDRHGPGCQELFEEMVAYHYEMKETDTRQELVVVRKDDDRVAALEYAIEKLERPGLEPPRSQGKARHPARKREKARV